MESAVLADHLPGVYLVAPTPEGPTKIGVTCNLQSRIAQLQIGAWLPLAIYGFRLALFERTQGRKTGQRFANSGGRRGEFEIAAYQIEGRTHRALRDLGFGLIGEWFDLAPNDCLLVLKKCAIISEARVFGIEDLAGADLTHRADPSMLRARSSLMRELAQVNNYIRIHNAMRNPDIDGPKKMCDPSIIGEV